ncbi:prepilin-type N-terminal cleavage/methylation domain-containing protein [Desulfoprunum benzoelyticum]|uniref:Prepilin-type N-terminal cleavage/methylation domain-containing protein n=1 Tax=Desulfoprunum benzoelyticum TaxID=1506996 RepID=A0A840UN35_9BACT|nr:prepilin-type N-terminal cleavage/methylation domain-containing protein [Desulfoprunum benzoelyticum]
MTLKKLTLNRNQKGFTLIELMIVIAIIGILAAIAIPNYISYRDKSFCSAAESDAQAVASGLADYFAIPGNTTHSNVTAGAISVPFPGGQPINMSGKNTVEVTAGTGTNLNTYRIRVTDAGGRCPSTYQQGSAKWSKTNPGIYSITL